MSKVILVLTDGFEEIEALATVDILRRAELDVTTVSLTDSEVVTGAHNIPVTADKMFADVDFEAAELLIIPGGTTAFDEHEALKEKVQGHVDKDKYVAAICAAPMVLGNMGLLEGKKATCYPGFEKYLKGADFQEGAAVVVDGRVVTGRGPGLAIDFALKLVELVAGKDKCGEVAKGLLVSKCCQ